MRKIALEIVRHTVNLKIIENHFVAKNDASLVTQLRHSRPMSKVFLMYVHFPFMAANGEPLGQDVDILVTSDEPEQFGPEEIQKSIADVDRHYFLNKHAECSSAVFLAPRERGAVSKSISISITPRLWTPPRSHLAHQRHASRATLRLLVHKDARMEIYGEVTGPRAGVDVTNIGMLLV